MPLTKTKKCSMCGKDGFTSPRGLSMHLHLAHDNFPEIKLQKMVAVAFFGNAKLSYYVKQLFENPSLESDPDSKIPACIRKYWKLLRAEQNAKEKAKEKYRSEKPEKQDHKQMNFGRSINPLTVTTIKTKLADAPKNALLGVYIKDLDTCKFIKDAKKVTGVPGINLITTKSIKTDDGKIDPTGKLITAEVLLYFLENAGINGKEQFFVNSEGAGAAKLTKIEVLELKSQPGVLFTFEYDKAYYKKYMQQYFAKRDKK